MRINAVNPNTIGIIIQTEVASFALLLSLQPQLTPYLLPLIAATVIIPDINKSIYSPSFQRQTAWVLLALAVMEAITGFAAGPVSSNVIFKATGGLLTRGLSIQLHILLIDPLAFFFILHIASGIGLSLIRRGIRWPPLYRFIIPMLLLMGFAAVVYLDSLML
ncbi:hypothetical protein [Caldivirga sp.]|uniref:hypothetical protein n=1 Tax=Caldivirga sp. TaxID=2080243 RepID=UPI0025B84A1F|nr:hypothetical protein [Caldivirga sp.]